MSAARKAGAPVPLEGVVLAEIRLDLGREPDLVLFRNAIAYGEFLDERTGERRAVRAGLPTGSSDLIGILTIPTNIGLVGRFFALEVKRPGRKPDPHQEQFLELVRKRGGFGGWADSVEAARACLTRARKGELS